MAGIGKCYIKCGSAGSERQMHMLSLLCRSQSLVFTYMCLRESELMSEDQREDHEREEEADGWSWEG